MIPLKVAFEAPEELEVAKPKVEFIELKGSETVYQYETIEFFSLYYALDKEKFRKTVYCESNGDPYAIGDSGHSRGLVQIHNQFHPEVTDEQAFDIDFSLNFLAEHLKDNQGHLWTCYRML